METEARWHLYTTLGLYAWPLQDMHHPPLGLGVYSRRAHCSVEHGQYHQGGRGATPVKICPEALTENGTWYLQAEHRLRHQAQAGDGIE